MAKIFYGLAGEGRGHASRVNTIISLLAGCHDITVYAPADAYDYLEAVYQDSSVKLKKISGLHWYYNSSESLDYAKTILHTTRYLEELPKNTEKVVREMESEIPDLVITDFDPLLPRAAKQLQVPFISLDHQHFLTTYDLSSLPAELKIKASIMGQAVQLFYSGQEETIVSSFYFPPLRPELEKCTQIGILAREEVLAARPVTGDHIIVYLRKFPSKEIFSTLNATGRPVHVYGVGALPSEGNLKFFSINPEQFISDLASSLMLVSTAGNQLIGEALFLGKPVLAIPERGNFEQEINGHFLNQSARGLSLPAERLTPDTVFDFIDDLDRYRSAIDSRQVLGNEIALRRIHHHLNKGAVVAGSKKRLPQ